MIYKNLITCLLLVTCSAYLAAGDFTCKIKSAADACVMAGHPTARLGGRKYLRCGHDNGGKVMQSYVYFHLPVVKGRLLKAELLLSKCYQKENIKGTTMLYKVLGPWQEKKISYQAMPKIAAKAFYTGSPSPGDPVGEYKIDVTSVVQQWLEKPQENFGLCLKGTSGGYANQLKFDSKEGGKGPVLILTATEKMSETNLMPEAPAMLNYSKITFSQKEREKIISEYKRPPFNKTGYLKTVWSAANPWFRPCRESVSRTRTYGGPDFAWHNFPDDGPLMWKEIAERYCKYGLTGLQFEIVNKAGFMSNFDDAAKGFKLSGNKLRIMPFLTFHANGPESAIDMIDGTLEALKKWFADPVTYKVDGHPVLVVYSPSKLKPDEWKLVIHTLEKKHGRIIWLFNAAHIKKLASIIEYVKVFDGTSMYGNWPVSVQKELFEQLAPVMHKDFPEKIFEVATHTNYTVHFHYGGFVPNLTEKFRKSWEIAIAAKPDAITATNWFDIYENSRIMPSYELDDIRLKVLQYYTDLWRKDPIKKNNVPDLYVANFTNVMLGQMVKVEVVSFPVKSGGKISDLKMQLCRPDGTVLYTSPAAELKLNNLDSHIFSIPALNFVNEKAVLPRVSYTWNKRQFTSPMLPQTNLVTSLRPHLLYWCRSLNHLLIMKIPKGKSWRIDNAVPGDTFNLPGSDRVVFHGFGYSPPAAGADNRGGNWVRILRNGREIKSFKTLSPWGMNLSLTEVLPSPLGALDWYNLELENFRTGSRYITPPIWVVSGERPGKIKMPVLDQAKVPYTIKEIEIEAVRVPFFYYECAHPAARILLDSSGYDHNGMIGNEKVSAGIIQMTLYRHEHTGYSVNVGSSVGIGETQYPLYKKDEQGGYLQFDGKSYAMLRGGTAFPYAATYEIFIKPDEDGSEQFFMGAANGQIILSRLADGRIKMTRLGATEGEGGIIPKERLEAIVTSNTVVPKGKWTHVAVVYDLRKLHLYINGKLEKSIECKPLPSQEWIGSLVFGGKCKFPYVAVPSFKGGIKKVRIYGRNLAPEEFLKGD